MQIIESYKKYNNFYNDNLILDSVYLHIKILGEEIFPDGHYFGYAWKNSISQDKSTRFIKTSMKEKYWASNNDGIPTVLYNNCYVVKVLKHRNKKVVVEDILYNTTRHNKLYGFSRCFG